MARKTHSELTAGIFVLVALAVLIGVIVWLGGADMLSPARQVAVFYADEDAGSFNLQKGSFVQIGDAQVGKIARIRFDADAGRTFYTAEIDRKDIKVHADGKVRVAAALIGGARLVITDRGSDEAPLADAEHPVALGGGLDQAMGNLEHASEKLALIADAVARELDSTESAGLLAKIHEIIDSLKLATADVAAIAADAKPKVSQTLEDVQAVASTIRTATDENLTELLVNLRESSTEVLKISRNFGEVSGQVRQIVMLHRNNIDEIIDNMAQVSANLKATAKEVRRAPWRLLHTPDEQELDSQNIYDAATAFSNGAEQLDQAISKLTGLAAASPDGLPADDPELLKIRAQLEEAFGKFNKAEQALWKELE